MVFWLLHQWKKCFLSISHLLIINPQQVRMPRKTHSKNLVAESREDFYHAVVKMTLLRRIRLFVGWIQGLIIGITFFAWAFFSFQKIENDSVNQADCEDIKNFVQFPGNSFLEISLRFWNCVGCVHMRERFILKITQCVCLITLAILICEIVGSYLILHQPTQF